MSQPHGASRHSGPVTLRTMVGALGAELGQLRETFRLTPVSLWLLLGVAWSALASLGVLPLGGWALVLQVVGFAALSLFLLWPEAVARVLRSSDSFGVKERDSSRVVTYLPVALATFGLPFYLAAQAVLFKNVMQHLPGVLTGSTWSDAWRLSLDNLLFTELFLDLFDIFGVGLAPEQPGLTGKVLVFITRLLLSIGFVRLAVELLRAAYYGALGLGRGRDVMVRLEHATKAGDSVLAGHLGRELVSDIHGTIEVLLNRRFDDVERPRPGMTLRALREWALPYLRLRLTHGDPRGDALEEVAKELAVAMEQTPELPPRPQVWRVSLVSAAAVAAAVFIASAPPVSAFAVGVTAMLLLAWLLVSPRASFEAAIDLGLVPYVPLDRLRRSVVIWSALLATGFVYASWGALVAAATAWPGTFGPADVEVTGLTVLGFIGSSLLRIQLFLSIPEVFGLGEATIEQRPALGSALTFVLRSGLNLGVAAVVVAALSVRRDREGLTGLLSVPEALGLRMEARRGGRYAHLLVTYFDIQVCGRLWRALDTAKDSDTQVALASSGAFDWCVVHESLGRPESAERMVSQSVVCEALRQRGWGEQAVVWTTHLAEELTRRDWPASVWAQLFARFASEAAHGGSVEEATERFEVAYRALLDDVEHEGGTASDSLEAQSVFVGSVIRALGVLPTTALTLKTTLAIAERAYEIVATLIERTPNRFITDALRLGALRATLKGHGEGAKAGLSELGKVVEATMELPRRNPWRDVLLLSLLGSVSSLKAMAAAGADDTAGAAADTIEAGLLAELGEATIEWNAEELTVRAYDERLGEELARSVGALVGLEPSHAAYLTASRAADIFEARLASGVFEARGHAVGMWMFAAATAFRLSAWADAATAAQRAINLASGMRPSPPDLHLLANTHAFRAQSLVRLGQEEEARAHASVARSLYERVRISDWDEAEAAVAEGQRYLAGL